MGNLFILGISITLAVMGQLLMKRGMQIIGSFPLSEFSQKLIPMLLNPYVIFGIACFALSSIFWLVVLSRMDLSMVYPMVSIGYIAVAIASSFWLGETVTIVRWMGIMVICAGVIMISRT